MQQPDLELAVDVARRAVKAGARAALRHFRTDLHVERKADLSPVTEADRESEAAMIEVIREAFPAHGILGEESGEHDPEADTRWIIDPLDGTRGFTRGGVYWGPLVALEHHGVILAGALALPVLERTYWAGRGLGTFRDGERLQVSGVSALREATVSLGELRGLLSEPHRAGVEALVQAAESTRCLGDLAGCTMLLDGLADVWLEAGVAVWDLAPFPVLVEEAGGRFTDLAGTPDHRKGGALATNGLLHDALLELLQTGRSA